MIAGLLNTLKTLVGSKKFKNYIFFEFFAEEVLKSLLRGTITIRKKYQVVFEKFAILCSKNREKKPTHDFGENF